ncbi:MAG: carboxypeptidase regulatory-like domain-containing protein, partial [Phaeodactylibacter sp.]|nr:carboxypeptidase regulatory-like domain-containing protein [Phaeodactylibacter sp.]
MKKSLFFLAFQLLAWTAFGQSFTISGSLRDAATNDALPGAHLILMQPDSIVLQTQVSGDGGYFLLEGLQEGTYLLELSYLGYEPAYRTIRVAGQSVEVGTIRLKAGIDLDEVQVTEQVIPVQQQGDTTVFNAKAFKTLPDADAGELLEKMPTVVVENGKVQAQGEDVQKVLVDGKPFFGDDPTAALRNLPAEVIDKIQIFDEQSDQSKFSGFDDGQTSKTINIVTKTDMRNGQFGKVYAGYGYENKYQAGGNINIFNGDQRISLIGMSNNINQQNFSSEDLLGVVNSGSGGGRRGGGQGGRGGGGRGPGGSSANDFLVSQQQG